MISTITALSLDDVKKEILEFCKEPQGKVAILDHIKVEMTTNNYTRFIVQLIEQRFIASDYLRKRSSVNQKFIITQKGLNYLKAIA